MKISVKRTGGFAGLSESLAEVDTSQLGPAAREVEQKLRDVGFVRLPAELATSGVGADLYRYEISVTDSGRRQSVAFSDDGGPQTGAMRDLVSYLTGLAKDAPAP